jgi:hypothetical protein
LHRSLPDRRLQHGFGKQISKMSKYGFWGFWVKNSGLMVPENWMVIGCHCAYLLAYPRLG